MRKLVTVILAVLGSVVSAHAQQAVLDRLDGKDLWNDTVSHSDLSRLEEIVGEVPKGYFAPPIPWRVWRVQNGAEARYIVLLGERESGIPGGSSACIKLFDATGARVKSWSFQTGWRMNLSSASLESSAGFDGDLIVIHIQRLINGRNIAREYFALSHDSLRFVRMEDDNGRAVQNEYVYPNFEIGGIPEANGVDEWLKLLESSDRADVLSALMFLGGRHLAEPERRLLPDPKESKYAGLFQQLIGDPRIRADVERLRQSDNQWVREAAELAARGPRERPLN